MFNSKMFLKILSTEEISKLGINKIAQIQALGRSNHYRLASMSKGYHTDYICDNDYALKRAKELTISPITKELSPQEKILFVSEVRFIDTYKIIEILEDANIKKEEIEQLNLSILEFKKAETEYQKALSYLENKHEIEYDRVMEIINKLYPLLKNLNYAFNEEDIKLYSNARRFYCIISNYALKRKKIYMDIVQNPLLVKLVNISKYQFDFNQNSLYIFLNKINSILVTNPELLEQPTKKNNQKKV